MGQTNDQIDEAIAAEERELLRQIGEEPNYFVQLGSIFKGRTGWVNAMLMAAQLLLFASGAYASWRFFDAVKPLDALRWGLPGAVLLLMSLIVKLALWPALQANRILLAIKRLEMLTASK